MSAERHVDQTAADKSRSVEKGIRSTSCGTAEATGRSAHERTEAGQRRSEEEGASRGQWRSETRTAMDEALNLTPAQQKEFDELREAIRQLTREHRQKLDGFLRKRTNKRSHGRTNGVWILNRD